MKINTEKFGFFFLSLLLALAFVTETAFFVQKDEYAYLDHYNLGGRDILASNMEIGYSSLVSLASKLMGFQGYNLLLVTFFGLIKARVMHEFGALSLITILLYFALQGFVDNYLLRATAAACFVLLAQISMARNKLSWSLFYFGLACSFHISSIVCLPLLFLQNIHLKKLTYVVVIFFLFIFAFFFPVEHVLIAMLNTLSLEYLSQRVLFYFGSEHGVSAGLARGSVYLYLSIFFAFLFYGKGSSAKHRSIILNSMLFAFVFLIGFSSIVVLSDRLFRFTAVFFIIAVGLLFQRLNTNSRISVYLCSVPLLFLVNSAIFLNRIGL